MKQSSFLILLVFIACVIMPESNLSFINQLKQQIPFDVNKTYYGIIHIPSLLFIVLSALILSSYKDQQNKTHKSQLHSLQELQETNAQLDQLNTHEHEAERYNGLYELEKNPLIKEITSLFFKYPNEQDLTAYINNIVIKNTSKLEHKQTDAAYIAAMLPLLGMIGTVAGLMLMFAKPDDFSDFSSKFSGLATALMTTLYATLGTALIYKPAHKIASKTIADYESEAEQLLNNTIILHNVIDVSGYKDYKSSRNATVD